MSSTAIPPGLPFSDADLKTNIALSPQAHHKATLPLSIAEAECILGLTSETPVTSQGLHDQRTENLARIELCESATAPHRRLPVEILSEIFTYCVNTIKVPIHSDEAPWCIARVCSEWREVVMKTPALWNDIQVNYQRNWSRLALTCTANEILSRSGRLYTSIKLVGQYNDEDATAFLQVLNNLVDSHSTRLRSVALELNIEFRADFLELPPGSLHFVDTVDLSFHHSRADSGVTVFQDMPRLRRLTLRDLPSRNILSKLSHPSQLTHIFLRDTSIDIPEAHLILRHFTQLLECHFDIGGGSYHEVVGPTHHFNLTTLTIRGWSSLADFVGGLVLPQLLIFEVFCQAPTINRPSPWTDVWTRKCEDNCRDIYIPFFRHIKHLQRLSMRQLIPESIIENVLRAVPTITALAVQDGDALPDVTLKLISQGYLIPKVDDICCYVVKLNPFLDMLEARGSGPVQCPKFERIFIDLDTNGGGAGYPARQRVKALKAIGYNITLRG